MDGIVSRAPFHISSGKIGGGERLHKSTERSAFVYQNFDYFAYLIWKHLHKDSLYVMPSSEGLRRSYSRKKLYNHKRLMRPFSGVLRTVIRRPHDIHITRQKI